MVLKLVDYDCDDDEEMEDERSVLLNGEDFSAAVDEDVRALLNYLISKVCRDVGVRSETAANYLFDLNAFRDVWSDDSFSDDTDSDIDICTASTEDSFDSDDSEAFMRRLDAKASKVRIPPPQRVTVNGELQLEDLPPIERMNISVDETVTLRPLGTPYSIVNQLVIIKSTDNAIALDNGTRVFDENRKAIGEIFETFGPVRNPFYSIRFNNAQEIQECKLRTGQMLYYAAASSMTNYVRVSDLQKDKGSDASWKDDVEPPPEALDFSDDEEQRIHQQKLKAKRASDRPNDPRRARRRVESPAQIGSVDVDRPPDGPFSGPVDRRFNAPAPNHLSFMLLQSHFRNNHDDHFHHP